MAHLSTARIGFAGIGGLDTSNRAPIENLPQEPGGPAFGIAINGLKFTSFVPATLQTNNIATSQIMNGNVPLTAGTGVTSVVINGITYLDLTGSQYGERSVRLVGATSVTSVTFTINGLDMYGVPVTQTMAGPTGAATVETTKTFRYIRSITTSGTTTAAMTIGTGDTYGFPARVNSFDQCIIFWDNALITATTGFTAADATNPATGTTANVRGRYTVQSASNGTRRLRMVVFIDNPDTMDAAYGVNQFSS
jgi:hypothetical protein